MSYLVRDTIQPVKLINAVSDPGCGGIVLFSGTVRASSEDGPVSAIEYSAYDSMAEAECERIVLEAKERWPDGRLAMEHRLGRVPLGEASIIIAAAAPHRSEAFEMCRYVIDEVKVRVPIWKREFFEEGEARWRSNEPTNLEG